MSVTRAAGGIDLTPSAEAYSVRCPRFSEPGVAITGCPRFSEPGVAIRRAGCPKFFEPGLAITGCPRFSEPGVAITGCPRFSEPALAIRRVPQVLRTWGRDYRVAQVLRTWARDSGCFPNSSSSRPAIILPGSKILGHPAAGCPRFSEPGDPILIASRVHHCCVQQSFPRDRRSRATHRITR